MKGGRPLKFKSVKEMNDKMEEYFKVTPAKEVTITGLALYLDTSRETLVNYEERDQYFDTIKKMKERVAYEYEKDLREKGRSGDIFALKNFGWSDKQEIEHSGEIYEVNLKPEISKLLEEFVEARKKDL
jgi:hypothetical protein